MKKIVLYSFVTACLTLVGCNNSTEHPENVEANSTDTSAVVYTCPMHPEVTSDKAGTCPKCNMDLEKKE